MDVSIQPNPHRIGGVTVHRHATMPDLLTLAITEEGEQFRLALNERTWRRIAVQLADAGVTAALPAVDRTVIAWGGDPA